MTDSDCLWHELVLNGIGGSTIDEAQRRLSYCEFLKWLAYRNRYGSLNPARRIEQAVGMLASLYANVHSKNGGYTMYDFAPHEEESEITLDKAMKEWS